MFGSFATRLFARFSFLVLLSTYLPWFPARTPAQIGDPAHQNHFPREVVSGNTEVAAARRLIEQHMKNLEIPGMQLAVLKRGKLVCSESFGFADLEKRIPVTRATSFRIGSVSKSLTAAALMVLVQRGLLDLNAPVDRYVPSFPKKKWPVTVRQLALHMSGIRHYASSEEASNSKHYDTVLDSLGLFENDPLLFQPGTRFEYSSYGYVLLSAVIEAVSKRSFPDLMRKEVFVPLGMQNSSMDYQDKDVPNRSKFYVLDDADKRVTAPFVDSSSKWASGGMIASADDLVKFGAALLNGRFLRTDFVNTLFTSGKTIDGKITGYGMGWEVRQDEKGRRVIVNDGSLPSARSVLVIYPQEQLVVAVLANTGKGIFFNREEALTIADLFLDDRGLNPSLQEKQNAIGHYAYSTSMEGESIEGLISIFEQGNILKGTMTIPNKFFGSRVIPIPVVRVSGSEVSVVGLPGNWISLKFTNMNSTILGSWSFGPLKGELTGSRISRE